MSTQNGWIKVSERRPTKADANERGEVWWWLPQYQAVGPQIDLWEKPGSATHWMPCRLVPEETPSKPRELTQAEKDRAAFKAWDEQTSNYCEEDIWDAGIAYERAEIAKLLPSQINPDDITAALYNAGYMRSVGRDFVALHKRVTEGTK